MVVLCGTFAIDEKCAILLVEAELQSILIGILKGKNYAFMAKQKN